jgi:hypothetical protein
MSSRDEFTERTKEADAARARWHCLYRMCEANGRAERGILRGGDQNVLRRAIAAWKRLFAEIGIPV